MQKEQINYKKSQKKQITYALVWFAIIMIFGVVLYPVNTLEKSFYFGGTSIILVIFALWAVRKTAQEAVCPHCNVDLYESIQGARSTKTPFNFCPACGKNVKI